MDIEFREDTGYMKVSSEGSIIIEYSGIQICELKEQLSEWLSTVDDEACVKSFIYTPECTELLGIFRIEPRPNGWQFTSIKEKRRTKEILSLQEWRATLKDVI
ncbi:MAG: hypothetical protein D3910_08890 [Candidatus Electrothrix sp. ATG2]|nr:hypothetical protein [Candidatus Electrothrix sp. ATG2]